MTASSVIIGANYGDEGKGLITDFEAQRQDAELVCRFNGGAQAGHTVVYDGMRHVFGHLASGTYAGASTYLSSKFIVNPMVLRKEVAELGMGPGPEDAFPSEDDALVYAHPNARVSTPYDLLLNALVEIKRGAARHGSCGLGINETVTRHQHYPLTVGVLTDWRKWDEVQGIVAGIRELWVPRRLAELGITDIPELYQNVLNLDPDNVANTLRMETAQLIVPQPPKYNGQAIFEGAQGLLLDEFMGEFPHVTRSMTGLPFAIIAAEELGIRELQPIYVTRSYLTRHGAGPLQHEVKELEWNVVDQTNIPNQWQGSLRFAPLNLQQLRSSIQADLARGKVIAQAHDVIIKEPTIALTCLDQLREMTPVVDKLGRLRVIESKHLQEYIEYLGFKISHVSRGPTANDVQFCDWS
jgi:adenylosuccinate synthase